MQHAKCKRRAPSRQPAGCDEVYALFAFCILNFALVLEFDNCCPAAALILRRGFELCDQRVFLEERGNRPAKLAGPVSVHDAQLVEIGHRGLVEELFQPRDRFVNGVADHVELGERSLSRLEADIDTYGGSAFGRTRPTMFIRVGRVPRSGPGDRAKILERGAKALAAHVDLGMLPVHFDHRALETEPCDRYAVAWSW